jgi:hypothetical protein
VHHVIVTDENGRDFEGLTKFPGRTEGDQKVPVWAFIDGENGFGADIGSVKLLHLKQLPDGKFGA